MNTFDNKAYIYAYFRLISYAVTQYKYCSMLFGVRQNIKQSSVNILYLGEKIPRSQK